MRLAARRTRPPSRCCLTCGRRAIRAVAAPPGRPGRAHPGRLRRRLHHREVVQVRIQARNLASSKGVKFLPVGKNIQNQGGYDGFALNIPLS